MFKKLLLLILLSLSKLSLSLLSDVEVDYQKKFQEYLQARKNQYNEFVSKYNKIKEEHIRTLAQLNLFPSELCPLVTEYCANRLLTFEEWAQRNGFCIDYETWEYWQTAE